MLFVIIAMFLRFIVFEQVPCHQWPTLFIANIILIKRDISLFGLALEVKRIHNKNVANSILDEY